MQQRLTAWLAAMLLSPLGLTATAITGACAASMSIADDLSASISLNLVGRWGAWPYDGISTGNWDMLIAADGNYVFTSPGSGWDFRLEVTDVTNPAEPYLAGVYETYSYTSDMVVEDGYAYLAGSYGLRILDVTDPTPSFVTDYSGVSWPRVIAKGGDYIYLARGYSHSIKVEIVDVSDPRNPVKASGITLPTACIEAPDYDYTRYVSDIALDDGDAYILETCERFDSEYSSAFSVFVIDVTNPSNPVIATPFHLELVGALFHGNARIAPIAGYAYIYDLNFIYLAHLIDIRDPAAPALLADNLFPFVWGEIATEGSHAFGGDHGHFSVATLIPPNIPGRRYGWSTEYVELASDGFDSKIALSGDYAYIMADDGLEIVDVSDLSNPTRVGNIENAGSSEGIAISGHHAYLANGWGALQIVDISQPDAPNWIADSTLQLGSAKDVTLAGNHAYVAAYDGGLAIIDITEPSAPVHVGGYDTTGYAEGVAVSGNYAYIADGSAGLKIIDIRVPSTPTLTGHYDTIGSATAVALGGYYAYVAEGFSGLQIVDVSIPHAPSLAGAYATAGSVDDVAVRDGYAYVTTGHLGLSILDIRDPSTPLLVGSLNHAYTTYQVSLVGNFALVVNSRGIDVVDISNPAAPTLVSTYENWDGEALYAADGYAYLGDSRGRLEILAIDGLPVIQHRLSVATTGAGTGTITSSPSGIDCGTDCNQDFVEGTAVLLNASADPGSVLAAWGGACTGAGDCRVTMDADTSVTATFSLRTYTVTAPATTGGLVDPPMIEVVYGDRATFAVSPYDGYSIDRVTGCGGSLADNTYTTGTIAAPCTVSATFALNNYDIAVAAEPIGGGSVSCSPNPVEHGSDSICTATANAGYLFSGWREGCSGSDPVCTLYRVTSDKSVTASFTQDEPTEFTLTVTAAGNGSGTVGGGGTYAEGTTVTPTASADAGSTFDGWTPATCGSPFALTANTTCTATFTLTGADADGQQVGVYRPSDGRFYLDSDADGAFSLDDWFSGPIGGSGFEPLIGDWNGDGIDDIGLYVNFDGYALFLFDSTGDGAWDLADGDGFAVFGMASGVEPLVGDWNGDGADEIGVYLTGPGYWLLDVNGDGVWSDASDRIIAFGCPDCLPVVGNWNADGIDDIGLRLNHSGYNVFLFDSNGNGVWEDGSDRVTVFGYADGFDPVMGDWNADGIDEIGLYQSASGVFLLDSNGNGTWDDGADTVAPFGRPGDLPFSGWWPR